MDQEQENKEDVSNDDEESYEPPRVVESARFETVASAQPYFDLQADPNCLL